jgi:heat shock protein HtpX
MGSALKSVLLLGILTALFIAVGYLFGGMAGATIGLIIALVMNLVSYWYSDRIVLRMYKAKKLDDKKINDMIKELADKAGIPKPETYIIETDTPNAFATGRSPKHSAVAVTRGLMNTLDSGEIEGVLAHEMSHIKNRDTLVSTIAATLAGALSWLGYIFYFGDTRDRNALSYVLLFILVPLSASLIRLAISRNREYLADKAGALISNPLKLASALEKISDSVKAKPAKGNASTAHMFIVNPFSGMSLIELFSTHPPTEKRVAALRSMTKA